MGASGSAEGQLSMLLFCTTQHSVGRESLALDAANGKCLVSDSLEPAVLVSE